MELTWAGGTIMVVSIGTVLLLTGFCVYRVLKLPPVEPSGHWKAPLEIDTRDTTDAD
jgi:hypothetical protein